MDISLTDWMSWDAGVDLVACTAPNFPLPNVIIHVARLVHTPRGSAASGLVFYQPDPAAAPQIMGFVSTEPTQVGTYFGPAIFAGTPFQTAPVHAAQIAIEIAGDSVGATVQVAGRELRTRLSGLAAPVLVQRPPSTPSPFWQQGVERTAHTAQLWVDGFEVPIFVPRLGITGGPAAVFAPCGLYAR